MALNVVNISEWLRRGQMMYQAKRLAEAEALFNHVLQACPRHPTALLHLGIIAGQTARNEQAVALLQMTVEVDDANAEAHNCLGEAYRALGRPNDALACYANAIGLNPSLAIAYNNRGLVYARAGRLTEAMEEWR